MTARWQHKATTGARFRIREDWAARLAVYVSITAAGIVVALALCHVGIGTNAAGGTVTCGQGEWMNATGDGCEPIPPGQN